MCSDCHGTGSVLSAASIRREQKAVQSNMVLHFGAGAAVCSGIECAVNQCKMSWFLKEGNAHQSWSIGCLCNVWEALTFQVNFMFDKFL